MADCNNPAGKLANGQILACLDAKYELAFVTQERICWPLKEVQSHVLKNLKRVLGDIILICCGTMGDLCKNPLVC